MRERLGRRFAGLSPRTRLVLGSLFFLVVLIVIFVAIVLPLLLNNGALGAEVDGAIPTTGHVGQPLHIQVAIDNTGDRVIDPVCIVVEASGGGADLQTVTFQGTDRITLQGGVACGGRLTTQETISADVVIVPRQRGSISVTLQVAQGSTIISRALPGSVTVS